MDIPRHSTDLIIGFPCPACNGSGSFGPRIKLKDTNGHTHGFIPCSTCGGIGWNTKRPAELTPVELSRVLAKLPP